MHEYIKEKLPTPELLAQLAEEAAELAHAALKLRRVYDGTNPTPTNLLNALANLHEEIADVQLLLEVLELDDPRHQEHRAGIKKEKAARWTDRLQKNERKQAKRHDPARVVELEAELAAALEYIKGRKDCETCKHEMPPDLLNACPADCEFCSGGHCKGICKTCYNGSKWKWRGAHGNL
jgi:hypothetical protein